MQYLHLRVALYSYLKPSITHAAGLSAEMFTNVPQHLRDLPRTVNSTPLSCWYVNHAFIYAQSKCYEQIITQYNRRSVIQPLLMCIHYLK